MSTFRESPNTEFKQLCASSRCSNLPLELINTIFRRCNRNDLKQCALTCRSWNAATRPIFFSKVMLRSTTKIDDLISLVMKDNAIGALVKEIYAINIELSLHSLYLFSKTFKNIESITFDNKHYGIYKSLYDLLSVGEFPSLKFIPTPAIRGKIEIYLKCVDIMKHRITVLDIVDVEAYESLRERLHTFIKLKTIKIRLYSPMPISAVNLLEDISQKSNLPSLKRIDINMMMNSSINNMLFSRIDDIQPMPNVSDLSITGYRSHTIIDDTFMRYIIKKFPNIQRLELLSYEADYDEFCFCLLKEGNQIVLSVDVTVKFLEYISRMSTFNVQHIAMEEKAAAIIGSFCSNIRKKALNNPPSLYIYYLPEIDEDDDEDLVYPLVSIKSTQASQRHTPSISVGLNPLYDLTSNNGEEEQKLIKHTGQYFTKITLDGIPTFSFRVLLTNIARYCVNLKELVILNSPDLPDETLKYDDLVVNRSLTRLTSNNYLNKERPNLLSLLSYLFPESNMSIWVR